MGWDRIFPVTSMKIGEKNVGMADRIIRIILGFILLYAGATMLSGILMYLVLLVGLVLLLTGIFGTCALYSLLAMNTLKKKA
jgi:hypothetical protein